MLCDLHTHSKYSFDGVEEVFDMCEAACRAGVGVLAITDHTEVLQKTQMDEGERVRLAEHRSAIIEAREQYAGRLKLLYACELGQPQFNPAWAEKMKVYPFDMVIGSIHFHQGDVDLYDVIYTPENYDEKVREYFRDTKEMIKFGGFHTLGHLDYILRRLEGCMPNGPSYLAYRDDVEEILTMLVERGLGLEVNTANLRKWLSQLIEPWILRLYHDLGGKYVTIGSDAHAKEDIGAGADAARKLIYEAGFTHITYFEKGEPVAVPLEGVGV